MPILRYFYTVRYNMQQISYIYRYYSYVWICLS